MNPNEKLDLQRDAIHGLAEQFNAANPRVVGQTTQNGSGTGTLDLLVDALPGTTLFDLGGLQIALETLLGVRVDLLTTGDLPSDIRELGSRSRGRFDGHAIIKIRRANATCSRGARVRRGL